MRIKLAPILGLALLSTPVLGMVRVQGITQSEYFNLLDYDVPGVAQKIPGYENTLLTLCDQITGGIDFIETVDPAKISHAAAMTLGYTAFFMGNTNYGAYYGKIPYSELTQFRKFGNSSGLDQELAARELIAHSLGVLAMNAAPAEEVLHGISSASDFRYDLFGAGKPTQGTLEELLETTEALPSFNIYASSNVIQLDHTQLDDQQEARLFALYKQRVEHQDPCHQRGVVKSHTCNPDRSLVPHLLEEVGLFEGDIYFQHAIRLLNKNPKDEEAWGLIKTALTLYEQGYNGYSSVPKIFRKLSAKATYSWKLRPSLDIRINQAKATIENRSLPNPAFWTNSWVQGTYKCASCHSK